MEIFKNHHRAVAKAYSSKIGSASAPLVLDDSDAPIFDVAEPLNVIAEEIGRPITEIIGEAPVFGSLDEELLERPIEMSWSPKGTRSNSVKPWTKIKTLLDLVVAFSKHEIGQKDGAAFLQGLAVGDTRKASAMAHMEAIGFDLDSGTELRSILGSLSAKNLMASIYSTHSHGKASTEVKRDELLKFAGSNETQVTDSLAAAYLREERGFVSTIAESAKVAEISRKAEGTIVTIAHTPIPKFRVIIPLKNRFIFAERGNTDAQAIEEWKERYAAAAELLNFDYDKSCTDPSRMLFAPRYPNNSTNFVTVILAGNTIDLDGLEIEPAEKAARPRRGKEQKHPQHHGNSEGSVAQGGEYTVKTPGLKRFLARFGSVFDTPAFAEKHLEVRSEKDGKIEAKCPNDAAHSTPDDPEDRAFCVFTGGRGFRMVCQHSHCRGVDRLGFMDMTCQALGLTVEDLQAYVDDDRLDKSERHESDAGAGRRTIDDKEEYQDQVREFDPMLKGLSLSRENGYIGKYVESGSGKRFQHICFEILPIARSRNEKGRNASLILGFFDQGNRWREEFVSLAEVHGNAKGVRRGLADVQFQIRAKSASDFENLLTALSPQKEIVVTSRPGWYGNLFLTPGGEIVGDTAIEHRLSKPWEHPRKGTLEGQLEAYDVALRSGVDHFAYGIFFGCVGTLVARAELDNAVGVLAGETSKGKSTAQRLGASAWGSPVAGEGCLQLCRTTDNRLELEAENAHATFLALDELKMLNERELQKTIFMAREGRGKARMTTDASAKPVASWRTGFLLSSERTVEQIVVKAGDSLLPGATVRISEIDVSNAPRCDRETMEMVEKVFDHYGHVGPRFAEYVAAHRTPDDLRSAILANQATLAGVGASPIAHRSAYTMAALLEVSRIMKAAGLIASDIDVEGIIQRLWSVQMAGLVNRLDPVEEAIAKLQESLVSRRGVDVIAISDQDDYRHRPVRAWYDDPASAKGRGAQDDLVRLPTTYFVATDALLDLAGGNGTEEAILRRLKQRGNLSVPAGKGRSWDRVRGLSGGLRWRNYRISFPESDE